MKKTMKRARAAEAYFPQKKRKRARAHNKHDVKVDWISGLSDDLLISILSFLSTKEAVQTCILSKRWKRVWAHLPIIKFNINEFGVDHSIGGSDKALRKSIARFEQFVNNAVNKREPMHLDRVCYVHDTKRTKFYKVPMQWLDRVVLLMPQLIDISIGKVNSLHLPDSVFSCATLQHLKIELLAFKKPTVMPASIFLPSLKFFHIGGVELHDNFAQNLLMGCPSLETLELYFCSLHFSSISSNILKELDILGCHQFEPMQISCPSLFSLGFFNYLTGGADISLKNMKSLTRASFGLTSVVQYFGGGDLPVLNFLGGLSNATQLILDIHGPELKVQLERDILNCKNFNNLKELVVGMSAMSFDFNLVASLLKLSPNVKKLRLKLDLDEVAIQEEHRLEVSGDALFQHNYIETVEISVTRERKFPQVLLKTLMKTLNTYVTEIGNFII